VDKLHQIISYIKYLSKAGNAHHLHSPYAYQLYCDIIATKKNYYCFSNIEALRLKLLQDNTSFEKREFGTGKNKTVSVREIAKRSVKPAKDSQLLFKLIAHSHSKKILEIGTSLGLSTAYMANADSMSQVVTLEGCEHTLDIAKKNFELLRLKNIQTIQGNFDDTLPTALNQLGEVDFVFFDGNHQYEATMKYFTECLPLTHSKTIFVFDDIYWSKGMTQAWQEICAHSSVKLSIDLFSLGLVFFAPELSKQHVTLRF
jgi:predicted O-methyltransferase YrrM